MAKSAISIAVLMTAAVLAAASPAAARSVGEHGSPGYTTVSAPYQRVAQFLVGFTGKGTWGTLYRSEPPNPGGNPDHNTAGDSSAQKWALVYDRVLTIPTCDSSAPTSCFHISSPTGARGQTSASGSIWHRHIDGLYPELDASERCRVSASTSRGKTLDATIQVGYGTGIRGLAITALDPVATALEILPSQCPGQGDSIDGLYDNYFTPGFSFASGYGPDRWFTSRTVSIPLRVLHRSSKITIHLADTAAGKPPEDCAVQNPSYEQCATDGSWSGVLTLIRLSST